MAAQVEVQTGEVGRTGVGGRLHLSPLVDSSNKSLVEGPSSTQSSLIITSEPSKPVPGPKPRLTPKPFSVDRNPTVRPILAPKPHTRPRPEPTRPTAYKPDPPVTPKPPQPNLTNKHRSVSTNLSRPAPTSFKPSSKLSTGQTTKPVAQPFKPAPPLTLDDPSKPAPIQPTGRQKTDTAGFSYSRGFKKPPAAEWSGSTNQDKERIKTTSSVRAGGTSMTRAKSMGFLNQMGQEEEEKKLGAGPEVIVALRAQPKSSRPRPVSAIFVSEAPTQTEVPSPASQRLGRRPLSADLTSKFESIGLSLHRRPANSDSKENTPEEGVPPRRRERESPDGVGATPPEPDDKPKPTVSRRGSDKIKEESDDEKEVEKIGGSIKRRISLLLDSSVASSPGGRVIGEGPEPRTPVQPIPEAEAPLGVKQRIKQLTEDTPPAQTPSAKPLHRPRPLPPDLTKRFASERSADLSSPSLNEATDRLESDIDPQRRGEDSASLRDQGKVEEDSRVSQEHRSEPPPDPTAGPQQSPLSSGVQTVRAALFENVVERHSVLVLEEDQGRGQGCPRRSLSLRQRGEGDDGSLVTATYREPVSPSSPLRVEHSYDTVLAVGESRAMSEDVPSAQLEDKAMTLRRRSEVNRPVNVEAVEDQPAQAQGDFTPASTGASLLEQQPRYLRVGALPKWSTSSLEKEVEAGKGRQMEMERQMTAERRSIEEEREMQREAERKMQMDVDREERREKEREEAAAPKRLKMLEANDSAKPRVTYFALTGQIQDVVSHGEERAERGDMEGPFDDYSVKPGQWGSQGKVTPLRRNTPLNEIFGISQQSKEQDEEHMVRNQIQERERGTAWARQEGMEDMEIEKQKQIDSEKQQVLESEARRQLEIERQKQVEFARKERERQKELEIEKQKELEKERLRELERQRQREMERDRQRELERQQDLQRRQELERERQREFERQQRELEMEKQKELERERQKELKRLQELERERQRELERERQRELERERQKEQERERQRELERERQREQERERQRQLEIQQELERQRQRELEQERQREAERQKEMDKERLRQLEMERQKFEMQREQQKFEELERIKEMERRQLLEFEKQKQAERERQQILNLEKQRVKERYEREEAERMRQVAIQQEVDRQRELERERQQEMERERQRELERQRQKDLERQKQLDLERQELDNQRARQREYERERQRLEDLERIKEMERSQLLELEKQKQSERQRQHIQELERQRLREMMERNEAEKMRQIATQQEAERQRMREKQKREDQVRMDSSPLRPKVLDLDSVTRDQPLSSLSSDPSSRGRQPSPQSEEHYRSAILDIDSFMSQTEASPTNVTFPVAGIQGMEPRSGARSNLNTPDREGGRRLVPEGAVGRPSAVWGPSQQDPWERRQVESVDSPSAGPEAPRKPPSKPTLEQLLRRQEERASASCLVPERSWTVVPSEPLPSAPYPIRDTSMFSPSVGGPGSPLEQTWFPREAEPQGHGMEARGSRRSQGSQELNRMRSRSVSRRSVPSSSAQEGSLFRMRSRSAHRERGSEDWESQKQSGGDDDEEGKDTDTQVHETDSQYGTWETGLRTDDSLTPATPTSEGNLTPSPRKHTPPHTPGEQAVPIDPDTPDGLSLAQPESQPIPFPETSTVRLDSSALRSRAQLSKKRGPRSRPTRASRQTAALAALPEGQAGSAEDWRYRDSTEDQVQAMQEDSEPEEPTRGADPRSAASQPQRVPLFPGMDPFALKAQLKKRGDSDNQTDGLAPSPSLLSRSPKSPFLPQAARVLPPTGGKENGEEDSPQWLKELKSKKRLSQYENDS